MESHFPKTALAFPDSRKMQDIGNMYRTVFQVVQDASTTEIASSQILQLCGFHMKEKNMGDESCNVYKDTKMGILNVIYICKVYSQAENCICDILLIKVFPISLHSLDIHNISFMSTQSKHVLDKKKVLCYHCM